VTSSAVALTASSSGWRGWDVDLSEVEDLDGASELLREGADSGPSVLYVEEDDEWFGVIRVDDAVEDSRVFLSDRRVIETSALAQRLFEDALPPALATEDDEEASRPEIEPSGDADILADLGVTGDRLMALTAEEGLLPSDVIAALAEGTGAGDALEELRGA